jgi:hypothetical protein
VFEKGRCASKRASGGSKRGPGGLTRGLRL